MQNPSRGSDSVALCAVHFLPTSWGPGHCQHLHLQRQTGVELHGLTATDRKDVYTSDDFATTEIGRNRWTESVPKRRSEQYFRSILFTLHEMLRGQIQSQTTDGRTHGRTHARARARAHTYTHTLTHTLTHATHTHTHTHTQAHTHARHTHTRTHTHKHTGTQTHTHAHTRQQKLQPVFCCWL